MSPLVREVLIVVAGLIALVLFILVIAGAGMAQPAQCEAREKIVTYLTGRFGEARQGMGLAANNVLMEVWASPATGTWTITATRPGGPTCIVAAGTGFERLEERPPAPGEPM